MADQRILTGGAVLQAAWYDDDGAEVLDPGDVTVAVTGDDGTVLLAAGTVTEGAGAAPRTVELPFEFNGRLDWLTAVWTSSTLGEQTTHVEVVGGFHVVMHVLRQELGDAAKYPADRIRRARTWWEDLAETYCRVAFVPRYRRIDVDVAAARQVVLEDHAIRQLRAVTIDGAEIDVDACTLAPGGVVVLPERVTGRLRVAYEHGRDRPPSQLTDAAVIAIADKLRTDRSEQSRRVLSTTNEFGGTTRHTVASRERPTGIPEVDAVLADLSVDAPLVG